MQRRSRSAMPHRLSGLSPFENGGEGGGLEEGRGEDVPPLRQAFAPMLAISPSSSDDGEGDASLGVGMGGRRHHDSGALPAQEPTPRGGAGGRAGAGPPDTSSLAQRIARRLPPDSSILSGVGPLGGPSRHDREGMVGDAFHLPMLPPNKLSSSGSAHSFPSRPSTAQSVQSVLSNASFGSQISVSSAMAALGGGGGGGALSRSESISSSVSFAAMPPSSSRQLGGTGVGGGSGGRGSVPVIPLVLPRIVSGRVCAPEGGGSRGGSSGS